MSLKKKDKEGVWINFAYSGVYLKYLGGSKMDIKFKKVKNCLIVYPTGEIDHHTSEVLKKEIDRHCESTMSKNIIVDFGNVNFMDSSGIGMIIGRYKYTHGKGGKTVVTGVSDNLRKIFTLSGLGRIIKIYPTVEDAVENI
jgi:anti-anti-sigma factor